MRKPICTAVLAAVVVAAIPFSVALAQEVPAAPAVITPDAAATAPAAAETVAIPANAKLVDLWGNLLHFIRLASADNAIAYGNAIIGIKPGPKEMYLLANQTDPEGATLSRGYRIAGLGPVIDQINDIIDEGVRQLREDPQEVARQIQALGAGPRQFLLAQERLIASGEYAVPLLINALADEKTPQAIRDRIIVLLPKIGSSDRAAVRPLSEGLYSDRPLVKQTVAQALGKMGYAHAAPYLKEVMLQEGLPEPVHAAATTALVEVAGKAALTKPVAELYYELARKYYYKAESLMPDARYPMANVWQWQEGLGVTAKSVPAPIFNYVYAMRFAKRALQQDPSFAPAVPLWLAADIHRQADLPSGGKDTTQPAESLDAQSMAMASGAVNLQTMLGQAIKDKDVTVALAAIEALSQTARTGNLVAPVGTGANPLAEALGYPMRQVRFLAALTLANAQPCVKFNGSNMVVPVLVEAMRQSGKHVAALVDPIAQQRNTVKDALRADGLEVFDADTAGKAFIDSRAAGGADLLVLSANTDVSGVVATIRSDPTQAALPVIVVTGPAELASARAVAKADPLVTVLEAEKADAAGVQAALEMAFAKASGPGATSMPAEASAEWAVKAANAIRGLAQTNNATFDLCEALPALVAATKDSREPVRVAAAGALAFLKSADAQNALFALTNDAQVSEETRLAAYAALCENIQRFDSDLSESQILAVVNLVADSQTPPKIRTAAARLLGLVAPPSKQITKLIAGQ